MIRRHHYYVQQQTSSQQYYAIIIIIIIIRRAPYQCVAPLATNSLHSDLSKASSIAYSKVRLCRDRSLFKVAIQEVNNAIIHYTKLYIVETQYICTVKARKLQTQQIPLPAFSQLHRLSLSFKLTLIQPRKVLLKFIYYRFSRS